MNLRHRLAATAAALTLATTLAACGNDDPAPGTPGTPEIPSASTPLKNSDWFRANFGTPLVAAGDVTPKTIEQPNDIKGTALPQNKAPLDGPVMWQRVRCAAIPFTTSAGPTKLRADTVYGGFAHTQFGAAVAAYHLRVAPWTAVDAQAWIATAATSDRDRAWKRLDLDQAKPSNSISDPDCVLNPKRSPYGLARPSRWNVQELSADSMLVTYWFPPAKAGEQGYTHDTAVQWVDGDWYLNAQELTKAAFEESGVPTAEPTGWPEW